MSAHNSKRRPFLRATPLIAAVMAMAVSTASAANVTRRASVRLRTMVPEAHATTAPARAMMLGGLSSKDWPVVPEISPDLKRVRFAAIGLDMNCTSGSSFALNDGFVDLPIGANGKVHATQSIPRQAGSSVSITGGSHSLTGMLSRTRLTFSGAWRLHLNFRLSGGQTDQCDSGQVSFTAQL